MYAVAVPALVEINQGKYFSTQAGQITFTIWSLLFTAEDPSGLFGQAEQMFTFLCSFFGAGKTLFFFVERQQ